MKFTRIARVAVIVPVHNRLSYTNRLLSELRRCEHDEALVVIVDDGSTDGTGDHLREHHPDVVVLPGSGDLWWSGAANLGCRFSAENGADILILLNNDNARVSRNCISDLIHRVETFGGCASSVAVEENSQRLRHAGGSLNWRFRGLELREVGRIYRPEDRIAECEWLPGMSLAFSATLFAELGGFDAKGFPQYYGDTDFTLRARELGNTCVVSYSSWVSNDERTTGLNFYSRVSMISFVSGLFSLRSNYQLQTTIRFARRHCPRRFLLSYLTLFYLRYAYATTKTWLPARLRGLLN